MMDSDFKREVKEDKPIIAICYDFDKTLSPDDMQAQGYIQAVQPEGTDMVGDFWKESNGLAKDNDMDQNLAYMYTMKRKARGQMPFTKDTLSEYGSKVSLFPGVKDWFERVKQYGDEKGVIVEHYIISSGLKEMIEGTEIARNFKEIFATSFYYDEDGVAVWPAQVVNYTNKTQFLFRISKGVLDVNDQAVNDSFKPEEFRIPFRNIVYIGDSDTDIPCMKLVNSHGGYSIGVFDSQKGDKSKVHKMMRDNRISYFESADYSSNAGLEQLIKTIIDKTVYNEKLFNKMYNCKNEAFHDVKQDKTEQEKIDLINELESSNTFANTHRIINKMSNISEWSSEEVEDLLVVAYHNSQVHYIIQDEDLEKFFKRILKFASPDSIYKQKIKELLD
ncbi:haloacid dehalogenase [Streptococcus sobrinus]|uniref:HAD family hydrolase n=1 Tax=Streptococcus sobrinus TaxID=1310 RepID=UPI000BA1BCD8|nr:HAD family hydrolase [Streptococcus sobrinus]OZV23460.1 haloacid dehalogenase [Streptococcus sobrinus]